MLEKWGLYSGYGYDAMWAIALALNNSLVLLANENKTLEQFDYEDVHTASVIKQSLANVDFRGVTVSQRRLQYSGYTNVTYPTHWHQLHKGYYFNHE